MKRYKLFVLLFIPLISSCFDDKGNYDYHEVAEITIEGLPELLEVVGGAEHIVAAPTVKSSLEGIITEDNPNFTFTYKMELKSGGTIVNGAYWMWIRWLPLQPILTYVCLSSPISEPAGRRQNYSTSKSPPPLTKAGWYSVTKELKIVSGWI